MNDDYFKKRDTGQIFFRKFILSIPFITFLFIVFILFLISTARVYMQSRKIHQSEILKEKALKKEEEKNKELNKKITDIQIENEIERQLREKFQIKKEGEEVVVFVNPTINKKEEEENSKNFISLFFRRIFGK